MTPSRRTRIVLWIATACLLSAGQPARAQDKEAELKQALLERRDTLEKLYGLVFDQIWIGGGSMSRVVQVERDLLAANLELCSTAAERIAVLEKAQGQAAKVYKRWQSAFTGNVVEVQQAKAAYLEIRVQLLREQATAQRDKGKGR